MFENNTTSCQRLSTDESQAYVYTNLELVLILGLLPLISTIGTLANAALLFTIYRVQHMRSTTNLYLANLAIADGLLLIVRSLRYTGTYLYSPIDYFNLTPFTNRFLCGLPLMLIWWLSFVSVCFICLVAIERYMSICRPVVHRRIKSRSRTMRLTLMSWMVPFVVIACHGGSFSVDKVCLIWPTDAAATDLATEFFLICPVSDMANLSITTTGALQFIVACTGNCTLYIFIIRTLGNRDRSTTRRKAKCKERNQVAKMLSINAGVFFLCLLPMQVLSLLELLTTTSRIVNDLLFWIAILAASLNSAINPLIYNASNPEYRKAFRRAFTTTHNFAAQNRSSSDTSYNM